MCETCRNFDLKTLIRWYMSPSRLASCAPGTSSSLCFRGCGPEGLFLHFCWTCSKVRRFWLRVYNFIYSLTGTNLQKTQQQALLGKLVQEVPGHTRQLIAFVSIAERKAIARSWESPTVQFDLFKVKNSWILINENLSAILNDKMKRFEKTWDPWIKYLSRTA